MKKIILTALAVLMMLGFAGCSGDLHDYVDLPPSGYWFYVDVDTTFDRVIFNTKFDGSNGDQTSDTTIDVSVGSVYYSYNGDNGNSAPATVFTGDNKPASQAGRIWVVSTLETFNVYSWNSVSNANNATWPGAAATKSSHVVED